MNTIAPPDQTVHAAAHALSDAQAKPVGALGRLEELAAWVAACQGECPPRPLTDVRVVVFAGDHGVAASGVSAYPAEVTPAMVHGILAGGAGVNALARAVGASVTVYDFGVRVLEGVPEEVQRFRIGPARPIHLEDALTESELAAALDAGDTIAAEAIAEGAQLLIAGDLGIGNTTPSAALLAASLDLRGADVAGRGTGIDDKKLAGKVAVIDQALDRIGDRARDPRQRLAALGSADIAAAVGFISGAVRRGVPVVVDGLIASVEALLADELHPGARAWMVAGHRSTEPGCELAQTHLGLTPILDLQMRLGEGSGAVLSVGVLKAAVAALREVTLLADL
ncbi:nicotinate-nucleotide--dimethylbenzimidazole phosphoribosyltransferase [Propioniciclava sp. MC1595]|uniref:nicotinate-nucleotide--dimethylbenzimidazole phosphoribosyltransferase n=1 Tax=Propioniciclava sp. MC1595 TaxID=2760308 RepID=UPI001662827B|nr:nicotinate-nucleotide--dimethylbenzimidazole phosphoribosyltransferase [Propioniciclava sp. MC1595]MBB1495807.1 nicotinate-nucleotide--dimethylbenzimidazole phosphoribosyltransferase [Propioniciclava sp. MC1595]QTE26470.1 nicotinate-nucleotide--dimethylbenzimidazole phosphoribosyltransferase [Propioniciclava sp. MC1595]